MYRHPTSPARAESGATNSSEARAAPEEIEEGIEQSTATNLQIELICFQIKRQEELNAKAADDVLKRQLRVWRRRPRWPMRLSGVLSIMP